MKHRTVDRTIAALTLFGLAAVAAPSRAADLDLTAGGQLIYEANNAIANDLVIALVDGMYAIHDPPEPFIGLSSNALAAGCDYMNNQTVTCPAAAIVSLSVDTKGSSDTINLSGVMVSAIVTGGGGPDTIIGGPKDDTIVWNTFDGSDVVDGGPGTDSLFFQSGNDDGTTDGYDPDVITILQNGAGFALYRDRGNVSMNMQNTEVLHVNTYTGNDTVATTGLVGTAQFLQTIQDGLPDTLTFDAAGLCPVTTPGGIESPGKKPVQYTNFANVSVINDTCVPNNCNGIAATSGCTVNGVRNQRCIGTAGDDVIQGTSGADVIVGGSGNDRINAGAGNDLACGDDGNDIIDGDRGNDYMMGGRGTDRIDGGAGGDDLIGGEGDDDLRGDAGIDDLTGGPGNDRLRGGNDRDVLQGSEGSDVLDGGGAVDTCTDVDQAGPFTSCELP